MEQKNNYFSKQDQIESNYLQWINFQQQDQSFDILTSRNQTETQSKRESKIQGKFIQKVQQKQEKIEQLFQLNLDSQDSEDPEQLMRRISSESHNGKSQNLQSEQRFMMSQDAYQSENNEGNGKRRGNNAIRCISRVIKSTLKMIFNQKRIQLNKLFKKHQKWKSSYAYFILMMLEVSKINLLQDFKKAFDEQGIKKIQQAKQLYKSQGAAQQCRLVVKKACQACKIFEFDNWLPAYDHIFKNINGDKIKNKNYYLKGKNRIEKGILQWRRKIE